MKKLFYLISCALLVAAACTKSEDPRETEPVVGEFKTITFAVNAEDVVTKMNFADGTGFSWENADLTNFGVAYNDGSWHHVATTGGTIESGKALLNATLSGTASQAYLYYPYAGDGETAGNHQFSIASEQTLAAAGSTRSLLLASSAVDVSGNISSADVSFHLAGSLLRFFVYDGDGSTEKVQKIQINANVPISGDYTYAFASAAGSPSNTAQQIGVALVSEYDLSGITAADQAKSVFIPILPGTTAWIDYLVTTDQNIYTFHSTTSRTFPEGRVTEVKLNLSKASSVSPVISKIGLTYHFTDKGNGMAGKLNQNFNYNGQSNVDLGWFIVAEDGVEKTDYSKPYYTDITSNDEVEWVRAFKGGNNNLYITCDENTSKDARNATLNVYFNETSEYVVVATCKDASGTLESISSTDPIISINVSQAGKPDEDDPSLKYLHYFFRNSPGSFSVQSPYSADAAGVSAMYLGYFFVTVGTTESRSDYTTATWYNDFISKAYVGSTEVDWARITKSGDNQLRLTVDANTGEDDRSCTVKLFYSGTGYTAYESDGTVLAAGDPVFSMVVNQKSATSKSKVIYDFYTISWSTMQQLFGDPANNYPNNPKFEGSSITAAGGTVHSGGQFRAFIDGSPSTNWTGLQITGDAVDSGNNAVDWVSNVTVTGGKVYFTLAANTTGAPRSATVRWFANDEGTLYEVVGTYYNDNPTISGNAMAATVKTITSAEPIFTLAITQPGS